MIKLFYLLNAKYMKGLYPISNYQVVRKVFAHLKKTIFSSIFLFLVIKMVISNLKKHLRHVLLWLYDKDNSISKRAASKELREVYGNEGFGDNVCGIWLKRFRDGNKNIDDLDDKPRSGRSSTLNDEELRLLVEMDPKATVRELAEVLQKSVSTKDQNWGVYL
jgi:transposase